MTKPRTQGERKPLKELLATSWHTRIGFWKRALLWFVPLSVVDAVLERYYGVPTNILAGVTIGCACVFVAYELYQGRR